MPDKPPKRRGRPRKAKAAETEQAGAKAPDPTTLGVDDLAAAEAAAAKAIEDDAGPTDTPPGSGDREQRRPRKKRVSKQVTQQIEDALAEILTMPAVPSAVLGDQWLAEHFATQGRALANRIALVSERNPVLRGWCERAMEGESLAVLLMAGIMYAAPPLMHFGLIPGGQMIGVPVLRRQAPEPIVPPAPEQPPSREAPEPKPYGGAPAENGNGAAPFAVEFSGEAEGNEPPSWQEEMIG